VVHVLCCLSLLLLLLLLTDLPGCSTFGPPREATTRLHWHRAPTGMRPAARPSRHVPCYVRVSFVSRRMMCRVMMMMDDDDDDDGWTTPSSQQEASLSGPDLGVVSSVQYHRLLLAVVSS
jgi:hypothetical protein